MRPPTRSVASRQQTSLPARLSIAAAARPATPAPIMPTSQSIRFTLCSRSKLRYEGAIFHSQRAASVLLLGDDPPHVCGEDLAPQPHRSPHILQQETPFRAQTGGTPSTPGSVAS